MIKHLTKVVLATALIASTLNAGEELTSKNLADDSKYKFATNSLVGFEGGYNQFDYESVDGTTGYTTRKKLDVAHGGIKIGAETESYRVFLSARFYGVEDFDYARTYGIEGQYKFNISEHFNVFMGVSIGKADFKLVDKTYNATTGIYGSNYGKSIKIRETYYGGDAGVNIHIHEIADLEIGARFMALNDDTLVDQVSYNFDNTITGYASIIFKYQMD